MRKKCFYILFLVLLIGCNDINTPPNFKENNIKSNSENISEEALKELFLNNLSIKEMQKHKVGLIYSPDKKHYLFKDYDKIYLYSSSNHESVLIFSFYQFMLEVYNQDKNIADISYYKLQLFWDGKSGFVYLHFNNYLKPHILSLLYYADGKTFLNLYNYQSGAAVDILIFSEQIGS